MEVDPEVSNEKIIEGFMLLTCISFYQFMFLHSMVLTFSRCGGVEGFFNCYLRVSEFTTLLVYIVYFV